MKIFKVSLLSAFIMLTTLCWSTDLVYQWKAGSVYRFKSVQTDDVAMSIDMNGMTMPSQKETYKTELTFALKVNKVAPNGTADGLLYIEQYKVTNKAGKLMASMSGIPKEALSSPVEVDKKGKFTFKKIVYMIVQDNATMVVTGKAEQNKVSASATGPDGTQLSVNAEFDPKTGTLKAGYSVTTVGQPKQKKVVIKEDAKELDLLPYEFLELLSLPEGDIKAGQTINSSAAGTDMQIKVDSLTALKSVMTCTFKQDMSKVNQSNSSVEMKDNDGMNSNMNFNNGMDQNMDMNMNTGDMNMEGMNMQGMDMSGMNTMNGSGNSGQPAMATVDQKMDGKITSRFDISKGMFNSVKGTINSSTNSAGVKMNVKSVITLTKI